MKRLQQIKKRLANATPGDWFESQGSIFSYKKGYPWIAEVKGAANRRLIKHAPSDIQFLLDTIEELQRDNHNRKQEG